MRIARVWSTWLLFVPLAVAACSAGDDSAATASKRGEGIPGNGNGGVGAPSGTGGSSGALEGAGGGVNNVPPEVKVEKAFEAPVATNLYVWAANPKTGRVAIVNSQTYQVKTASAGEGPTYIAAIPGQEDKAIVINVLSAEATYLSQQSDGSLLQKNIPLDQQSNANSWAVSRDGHFAIAWTDVSAISKPDPFDGFQTISIIDLSQVDLTAAGPAKPANRKGVGFRPSSISFTADSSRAFAVTEDGISVINLADPNAPVRLIKYPSAPSRSQDDAGADAAADGASDAGSEASSDAATDTHPQAAVPSGKPDVSITPGGDYAILRREGSPVVSVIDLAHETSWSWTLSGPVTDIDLADTGDRAVAVVRSSSSVAVLPVPGTPNAIPEETKIEGETIGSVRIAKGGKTAVLFTNALPVPRVTVLHLNDGTYDTLDLHAPVLAMFLSPTAEHAVVIHNALNGQLSTKPGAFSIVPLNGSGSPVIQTTDAAPMSVAISPKGDRAIIPAKSDQNNVYLTYFASLGSGIVDRYVLGSPPSAAGFVGDAADRPTQAFISQDHPEGRVSFVDSATGQIRTITGFELGASVIEWSSRDGGK